MTATHFVALEVARSARGDGARVRVRSDTAAMLGWSAAFPTEVQAERSWRQSQGRTGFRYRNRQPHRGGTESAIWLVDDPRPGPNYRRFRFRIVGNWTRQALLDLVAATVPQVHAITAGRLSYHRSQAAPPQLVP